MEEENGEAMGLPVLADLPECSAKRRVRFLSILIFFAISSKRNHLETEEKQVRLL